MATFDFEFDRFNRSYQPDETITCTLTITSPEPIKYKEVSLTAYCSRTLNPEGHGIDSFDGDLPKVPENLIWTLPIPLQSLPQIIPQSLTLSFTFKVPKTQSLPESVRGKFISVDYFLDLTIKRGLLQSTINQTKLFFIVNPPDPLSSINHSTFDRIIDTIDSKRSMGHKATYKARIFLQTTSASFTRPPNGFIEILETSEPIDVITVSYVRMEKITVDKTNPQTLHSEKSRTQIAENDPPLHTQIPFNLEWVRVHIGPDVETPAFSMSTNLKVRILFVNGAYASCIVPLKLYHDLSY